MAVEKDAGAGGELGDVVNDVSPELEQAEIDLKNLEIYQKA